MLTNIRIKLSISVNCGVYTNSFYYAQRLTNLSEAANTLHDGVYRMASPTTANGEIVQLDLNLNIQDAKTKQGTIKFGNVCNRQCLVR